MSKYILKEKYKYYSFKNRIYTQYHSLTFYYLYNNILNIELTKGIFLVEIINIVSIY